MKGWICRLVGLFLTIMIVMEKNQANAQVRTDTLNIRMDRMPIRAKKAGASFKNSDWRNEELLNPTDPENSGFLNILLPMNREPILDNNINSRNDKIPIRARQAGASMKVSSNLDQGTSGQISDKIVDFLTNGKSDDIQQDGSYVLEQYGDYSGERNCLYGTFWHIRGYRCVPIICLHLRDINTGECLQNYSSYWGGGRRYWFYKQHGTYRGKGYLTRKY